ncbi:MAG: diguanylate cyclase [Planctomycetaceae bacterium]|nr:diguanylate cyclase [Planctomycetaceae bacterium]
MNHATVNDESLVYCRLTPAVPTDTCAIINRLLTLSDTARRELMTGSQIPVSRGVMTMLLRVMQVRDPSIILHGQRIATICRGVSELLGWDDSQRAQLELAALLHDLGKIGVPEQILRKPGKLSSEEYDFVSLYHHAATAMLQALHVDPALVATLTQLHHNFDGAGVDATGELPLGPRILAVADAYDSLSSPKSYRRGMTHDEVMRILNEQSGSRYDGNVIRTLNRWYEASGDSLFGLGDPIGQQDSPSSMTDDERNEVVVMSQILATLYQFQSLYDGYFIVDSQLNYCIWSDGMQELSGRSLQQVMGRAWNAGDVRLSSINQTKAGAGGSSEEIVPQVLRNGRPQFGSRVCEVTEGQQISVDVYTMPISSAPGRITGVVQLFRRKGGVKRQSREYVELKLAATRDALTGVANRGQLETQLRHLLDDYHNHEGARSLSAIFLDVDKFKKINDTHGHNAGDQVLVDLTRLLQHETYSGEVIARYGGEEFVVLCPDTDLEAAVRRAERLRDAITKSSIGGISGLSVTSSFGVSTAHVGDTVQTLLERADACLYRAKETGRNKTCWEGQDEDNGVDPELNATESETRVTDINGVLMFCQDIEMSTSLELTAMKLNAFIDSVDDLKVTHQDQGHMTFRLGSVGFTRRWGTTPERQAVDLDVRYETSRVTGDMGKATTRRRVSVSIVPHGKAPDAATFELRCLQVMLQLRSYLLGS